MPHLLNLPIELLERILALLCRENAQSIQACRQTCHSLNTVIAQSRLVQYLERVALLGMYDVGGGAASAPATLALPDREAALRAWEESWTALAGGHDGEARVFWQERGPDLRIVRPPPPPPSSSSSARVRHMVATIIDPEPPVGPEQEEEWGRHGLLDLDNQFSFGPWFITATRSGYNVRASYSYLDLHGYLDAVGEGGGGAPSGIQGGEEENGDRDRGADYGRVQWTVIKVPVRNVMEIALSAELDLAVIISCVIFNFCLLVSHFGSYLGPRKKSNRATAEFEGQKRGHLAVRPLRFRDGTPHPCAKVPTMRFGVTRTSVFTVPHVQVLGDYILLWIGPGWGGCPSKLYLIAWKQGSITLVSIHYLSYIGGCNGDDDSSVKILCRSMELLI
jgi:hypothetical protein